MYKKIFELINEEINSILANEKFIELKKLEIRQNKVKLVFLITGPLAVKVINYISIHALVKSATSIGTL